MKQLSSKVAADFQTTRATLTLSNLPNYLILLSLLKISSTPQFLSTSLFPGKLCIPSSIITSSFIPKYFWFWANIIAIDAVVTAHFREQQNIRDLNKAFLGFKLYDGQRIATGTSSLPLLYSQNPTFCTGFASHFVCVPHSGASTNWVRNVRKIQYHINQYLFLANVSKRNWWFMTFVEFSKDYRKHCKFQQFITIYGQYARKSSHLPLFVKKQRERTFRNP